MGCTVVAFLSTEHLKHKRDRLQMYKDSMMYQLQAKAKQLAKFENGIQWTSQLISNMDQSTQNDSSGLSNNSSANPAFTLQNATFVVTF